MNSDFLPHHERVRQLYRENRYCQHLSDVELNLRFRDIFINLTRLNADGKIATLHNKANMNMWMDLWTHVLEELVLRNRSLPPNFKKEIAESTLFFTNPVPEVWQKAAHILLKKEFKANNVLIKFGKTEYMQELFEYGRIRIQSASYYTAPNHNGAIRDDELSFHMSLPLTTEGVPSLVINPQDAPSGLFGQRFDITFKSNTDYWLYCMTTAIEPRLFMDFEANSCVIIKDVEQFQKRFMLQHAAYFPNTNYYHGKAVYIDPLMPSGSIDIPISKHFRYTYQNEYRFIWKPTIPTEKLNHIDLELGSLKDIAELVTL